MNYPDIEIKPCPKEGMALVIETWLNSFKVNSSFARKINKPVFMKYHRMVISRILERKSTLVLVASSKEVPDVIYGYLVCEKYQDKEIIHYVFIKEAFRGLGLSKMLIEKTQFDLSSFTYTHFSDDCITIMRKHRKLIYNPYLV